LIPSLDTPPRRASPSRRTMFSILAPGKHIPDHCGPYKGVIRYHLGLKVPRDARQCRIRVGDEYATWAEGTSELFDDTYEHEVWNDTDEERVVLFCDVVGSTAFGERPDSEDVSRLLRSYQSICRERIESHGGGVEKFIGDAVVGVFGVPLAGMGCNITLHERSAAAVALTC